MRTINSVLVTVVILAMFVFGGVNFKAQGLKVSKFEAQTIELNVHGVIPRAKL